MTTEPERFASRDSFNFAQVEGALCVYEWMLEAREKSDVIDRWFDIVGSPGMRMCAMQAGDICDRAFKLVEEIGFEFIDAYDFEFVPGICAKLDWNVLCDDNQYNKGRYNPDIHALVAAMIAADRASTTDPMRRMFQRRVLTPDEYITACRREAERQWGYGDLVSDHSERITQAMELEEAPSSIVYDLGVKYGLTPRSGYLG